LAIRWLWTDLRTCPSNGRCTETEQGPLKVTMSLGVATYPLDADQKAALVERADGCLYHAKRHGRNQCVAAAQLEKPGRASA